MSQELRPFFDFDRQLEERELEKEMEEQLIALSGGTEQPSDNLKDDALKAEIRLLEHRQRELEEAEERENNNYGTLDEEMKLIGDMYGIIIDGKTPNKSMRSP